MSNNLLSLCRLWYDVRTMWGQCEHNKRLVFEQYEHVMWVQYECDVGV